MDFFCAGQLLFTYFINTHSGFFRVTSRDGSRAGDKVKENIILVLQTFYLPRNAAFQIKLTR